MCFCENMQIKCECCFKVNWMKEAPAGNFKRDPYEN